KLTCFYYDNGISIDGEVQSWFSDDTPARFRAYGWHVIDNVDGHDAAAIDAAIIAASAETARPTLICCKTRIGFGSPNKEGTAAAHGSPLGAEEIAATRARLGWQHGPFEIPEEIYQGWDCRPKGAEQEQAWLQIRAAYGEKYPELAAEYERRMAGDLPAGFSAFMDKLLTDTQAAGEKIASRQASGQVIAQLAGQLPELIGGSADLSGSNCTNWPGMTPVTATGGGNYIYYGVREFGMTAIGNGMALHGGLIPFSGTFLIFMEYARNAARMAALMKQRNILVYTHDSIGQGEDGPTHQPVEQLANLRATPNMTVWRPADSVETVAAWRAAIEKTDGPTALVFSRQGLPCLGRDESQLAAIARGGYTLVDSEGEPELILIATGSEVALAVAACDMLTTAGHRVRVVSMPSTDVFCAQDAAYQESVLPSAVRNRLAIEAAQADYWYRFTGLDGRVIGMTSFGESAPGGEVMKHFGFSVENVVSVAKEML
ncbi:MAG: transketolase, partial [Pseudomonadales bacterium]|nr:transketolase [Pseudomonadales bacterium]